MWVVTDHPKDFPHWYVARKWIIGEGPTSECMMSEDLDEVQDFLADLGLVKLLPDPLDDPVIVAVWI